MLWLRCIGLAAGVLFSVAVVGYEIYKWQRNQRLISEEPTYNAQEKKKIMCGICLKNLTQSEAVILPCEHIFCSKCLEPLLSGTQTTCCDCRMEITPHDLSTLKLTMQKLK